MEAPQLPSYLTYRHGSMHTHALKLIYMYTCMHTRALKLIYMYAWMHTRALKLIYMYTWMHTHALKLIYMYTWMHTHPLTHTYGLMHTHAVTLIHAYACRSWMHYTTSSNLIRPKSTAIFRSKQSAKKAQQAVTLSTIGIGPVQDFGLNACMQVCIQTCGYVYSRTCTSCIEMRKFSVPSTASEPCTYVCVIKQVCVFKPCVYSSTIAFKHDAIVRNTVIKGP